MRTEQNYQQSMDTSKNAMIKTKKLDNGLVFQIKGEQSLKSDDFMSVGSFKAAKIGELQGL